MKNNNKFIKELSLLAEKNNVIDSELYSKYDVKKGLRNKDGTGVIVGLTEIGEVHGYKVIDDKKVPDEGILKYRQIDVSQIVEGFQNDNRFGFEETSYLLIFGELPSKDNLNNFCDYLGEHRKLPEGFIEDMILKSPSVDIMNKLARSVLVLYSYDKNPDDLSISNIVRQSMELIARFPALAAYGYQAKNHFHDDKSLYIHRPKKDLSTAENILYLIRPDNKYTKTEAELLDLSLVLHAEHGGGNNSTFATRVVSSSGSDTYSAISSGVGSLRGPKHGGANSKVVAMMQNIKDNVLNWNDKAEIKAYLKKILNKEVFDKTGLIYGMGHAIYTLSDPRARILKEKALELAKEKERIDEYNLYCSVEEISKDIFKEYKNDKAICANVDLYSGFVYSMLNIPMELYTPLFAVARVSGWCAHRIEELISVQKIIRPAYQNIVSGKKYISLCNR